jgi:hypothetical protein
MWIRWDKWEDGAFIVCCFSFLADKIAYIHEFFGGFAERFLHRGGHHPSYALSFRPSITLLSSLKLVASSVGSPVAT